MKKLFLIPLMACAMLFSTNLWADNVATLAQLQDALKKGGEITLTANIDAVSTALTVSQATTIDGAGFAIKSSANAVLTINTTNAVTFKNLIVYASLSDASTKGIAVAGALVSGDITLDNVTVNTMNRGLDVMAGSHDGMKITIRNSNFNIVNAIAGLTIDENTGVPADYTPYNAYVGSEGTAGYSRGINIVGDFKNSTVTVENTTIRGFYYCINPCGTKHDFTGSTVNVTNSTFYGRAALNAWSDHGTYVFNDCKVTGVNIWGGPSEGFSCFVINERTDNSLTINGGTVVSTVFNKVSSENKGANQFMVDDRGTNTNIIINNAQYTCTKDLGIQKGGVVYNVGSGSTITVNGGVYDCPEIIAESKGGQVVINNGDFDVMVVTERAYWPAGYEANFTNTVNNITINGGTFQIAADEDITDLSFKANTEVAHASIVGEDVEVVKNNNGNGGSFSVVTEEIADATKTIAENTNIETNQTAERVDIIAGKHLVVKSGTTYTVGKGGMVFGDKLASVTVEPGATVVLNGLLYNAEASNVIIQSDAVSGNQGVVLIDPEAVSYGATHPEATFEIVSRAYNDGGAGVWQRFGIPSFAAITGMTTEAAVTTYIYDFDNTKNDWRQLGKFDAAADADLLAKMNNPFACYNMICSATEPGTRYTISGKLLGNDNGALDMYTQYNAFANSYSGKINMAQLLSEMYDNDDVAVTVYAWKPAGNNSFAWEAVDLSNYDINDELHQNIQPMQCFIILAPAKKGNIALDYEKMVWNPATGISNAPARRALPAISNKVQIVVRDANNNDDNVILLEGDRFSSANDRGYDAVKYMNENLNLYVTSDEKMAHVATDNLEGQFIGMSCVEGGEFTMSFDNLNGETLVIRDMLTNATISMKEGETYTFTAENNSAMDYRFQVIGRSNVATDVEEVEAAKTAGIYTLTGVYVGDVTMWNNLPQGVYVVNGEKKVK
jgi:hypothetical protein